MALGTPTEPSCSFCNAKESIIWQKNSKAEILCLKCHDESLDETAIDIKEEFEPTSIHASLEDKKTSPPCLGLIVEDDDGEMDKDKEISKLCDKKDGKRRTRKGKQTGKGNFLKGKGRRIIFKKSATKAPVSVSTPTTSEFLFHQGIYYQVGDIVSVIDVDGGTYYAQIRGLLQDQYCEKSAVLTWILPTKASPSPEKCFDPSTYVIGPDEEIPRKLDFLSFVCHAPSEYYKDRFSPYATVTHRPESCFVWSKLGPIIKPIDSTCDKPIQEK